MPDLDSEPTAKQIRARYGMPRDLGYKHTAAALRAMGMREELHPSDALAFLYPSREAFAAFADGNRRHHGLTDIGPLVTECGIVGVVDLRPELTRLGTALRDPADPD